MDTRITPPAQRGMALFREPDGSSVAGDAVPRPKVEKHIPGQGHSDRGATGPVRGIHEKARRLNRCRQGHRGPLSENIRVATVDQEAGNRQRHPLHDTCHGAYTLLLDYSEARGYRQRHRFRHLYRHSRGHFFRHLWGHFWGHILYR